MMTNSLLAGVVLAGTIAALAVSDRGTLAGNAEVINGNTMRLGGATVRLWGIKAPEATNGCPSRFGRSWGCRERSAFTLFAMVYPEQPVTCEQKEVDSDGSIIATCRARRGGDLGSRMVLMGMARAAGPAYADEEAEARREGIGIWEKR